MGARLAKISDMLQPALGIAQVVGQGVIEIAPQIIVPRPPRINSPALIERRRRRQQRRRRIMRERHIERIRQMIAIMQGEQGIQVVQQVGLDVQQMEKLPLAPVVVEQLEDVCAICQDVVTRDQTCMRLPCLHFFHENCVRTWLEGHNGCPQCQFDVLAHLQAAAAERLADLEAQRLALEAEGEADVEDDGEDDVEMPEV